MPSIINSDDGVVSGTSGLKTTGGNDGITVFQQNGTDAGRVNASRQWNLGPASAATPIGTLDVVRSVSNSAIEEVARISRIGGTALYGSAREGALTFWDENNGTLVGAISGVRQAPSSDYNGGVALYVSNTGASPASVVTSLTKAAAINSSSVFQFNSGYGSVANAYGCRAWIRFNGTGVIAINGSANVSSVTDGGTGNYTVNFSTSMPDANYSTTMGAVSGSNGTWIVYMTLNSQTASGANLVSVPSAGGGGGPVDHSLVCAAMFR